MFATCNSNILSVVVARVSFEYLSVMSNKYLFRFRILSRRPRMSIATNSSDPLVGTAVVFFFMFDDVHPRHICRSSWQLYIRLSPRVAKRTLFVIICTLDVDQGCAPFQNSVSDTRCDPKWLRYKDANSAIDGCHSDDKFVSVDC